MVKELYNQLHTLTIFRGLLQTPLFTALTALLSALSADGQIAQDEKTQRALQAYSAFAAAIYASGGNLSVLTQQLTLEDENFYLLAKAKGQTPAACVEASLQKELTLLQKIAQLTPQALQATIDYDGWLPVWETSPVQIAEAYAAMVRNLPVTGYGMFARYNGFTVKDGKLVPIQHMDEQTIDTLYGYQRERNLVLENTRALVEGGKACNVLLYGDAGTGKSSTIKAVARHFFPQGLRIVEFQKNQLADILPIMEFLSEIPLKFIFYIDDLSFSANDDTFCSLKGILEGSAASYAGNIAVYATSNRRHLIKESMEDRIGNQLHVNDTLQETMSLAARFGLTITFSSPEKDLYLAIVRSLADEEGLTLPPDELARRAEAFALRQNGRSPRTAKQFVRLAKLALQ